MLAIITFEDLFEYGELLGPLPEGYGGLLRWTKDVWFITRAFVPSTTTGNQVGLFNAHGQDISVESERAFDLAGISLCPLWAETAHVDLEGWEESAIKYATTVPIQKGRATHLNLDWKGIDEIHFKANDRHFVINNITIDSKTT